MLERNEKLSQNSIHFYGIVIKMYLRKTGRDVEKLDQISMPKQEFPRREHIAADDWETFLGAIDDEDDYVFFDLLLLTGMRVGGLLTLKLKDIKWRESLPHHGEVGVPILIGGILSGSPVATGFGLGLMLSDLDDKDEWFSGAQ